MSDVIELIVCDKDGVFTEPQKGKIVPASGDDENIYTFYAVKDDSSIKNVKEVQLTMPVGGEQNGVLRLPKIGERILVIVQGNSYYLLSYLPNRSDMEFRQEIKEKDKDGKEESYKEKSFVDKQAFSIRYQSPNPLPDSIHSMTGGSKIYSELKFSTQETLWPAKNGKIVDVFKNSKNEPWKDSDGVVYSGDSVESISIKSIIKNDGSQICLQGKVRIPPKVDRVELLSTGDLCASAGNFNAMAGRRVAVFSGDEKALSVDDYDNLKQGDILGKAGHQIYLEAQNGIVLKCGRSEIRMDDAGITIVSAKIDPQFGILDDSKIVLDSRTGVTIGGTNVDINANSKYKISERCGGSMSSFAGMMRISGRDVQVASQNLLEAGTTLAGSLFDYTTMGVAVSKAYTNKQEKKKNSVVNIPTKVVGQVLDGIGQGIFAFRKARLKALIAKEGGDSSYSSDENRKNAVKKAWLAKRGSKRESKKTVSGLVIEDEDILTDIEGRQAENIEDELLSDIEGEQAEKNPTDIEDKQAEKFAEDYINEKKADKHKVNRSPDKKRFINGSQAVSVSFADMALAIADMLVSTTKLVFASIEKEHEDKFANKGSKQGENSDSKNWTGSDLRDRCNKGYYWAIQSIVEALNGACFGVDIAKGVLGSRWQSALDTSSIRFHGGYGDITCSSVEEKGVQFIRGTSPTASSIMSNIQLGATLFGVAETISTAGVDFASGRNEKKMSADYEKELKYL